MELIVHILVIVLAFLYLQSRQAVQAAQAALSNARVERGSIALAPPRQMPREGPEEEAGEAEAEAEAEANEGREEGAAEVRDADRPQR